MKQYIVNITENKVAIVKADEVRVEDGFVIFIYADPSQEYDNLVAVFNANKIIGFYEKVEDATR